MLFYFTAAETQALISWYLSLRKCLMYLPAIIAVALSYLCRVWFNKNCSMGMVTHQNSSGCMWLFCKRKQWKKGALSAMKKDVERRNIDPCILNLHTTLKWKVSCSFWLFYPRGLYHYPVHWRRSGPQSVLEKRFPVHTTEAQRGVDV